MLGRLRTRGFTLIELLVVVAIIALLISILLPSLKDAREQGKRALCLANMRSIGQASHSYSTEDEREHAVPIFMNTISPLGGSWTGQWRWRTALPFCYGGGTPTIDFPGQGDMMRQPQNFWGANHRPMNLYIYGSIDDTDEKGMKVYRCPSDEGYPDSEWVQDAPPDVFGVPCFDYLGNSYRLVVAGYVGGANGPVLDYYMSIAPWGHRMSSLVDTGKLAMYSEPMWYNFSRRQARVNPDLLPIRGWHNKKMTDNVAFADGSARSVRVDELSEWDPDVLAQMNITPQRPWDWFLRRGSTWRTDCYPTVGAFIRIRDGNGGWRAELPGFAGTGWPANGYQDNIVDPDY